MPEAFKEIEPTPLEAATRAVMKAPGLSADIAQPGTGEIHVAYGRPSANAHRTFILISRR